MLLSSLPLDVLLVTFQYLNIVDIIHVGVVSPLPIAPLIQPCHSLTILLRNATDM